MYRSTPSFAEAAASSTRSPFSARLELAVPCSCAFFLPVEAARSLVRSGVVISVRFAPGSAVQSGVSIRASTAQGHMTRAEMSHTTSLVERHVTVDLYSGSSDAGKILRTAN